MRRRDREVTDAEAIELFISKQQVIRIGFYDNGEVYIVPVNYGYELNNGAYTFYFHGAKAGRKYELAKSQPCVGFEIDGEYSLITADKACGHSARFQSVIGNGTLAIVDDEDEKLRGLNCLMTQLTGKSGHDYSKEMLKAVAVFKLEAKQLSCKAKV
ncbi:MAG: pyridoxamine 5'-phosphate oxidase family protein [Ruminococcus sp.]|nr:pyridoxamine 5'-phosphate oxidase family protein [Ruminococcus sp.]